MSNDCYMKSGMYVCEICKNFFTAHTRVFLSKENGYACPYCRSTDFKEQERFTSNQKEDPSCNH